MHKLQNSKSIDGIRIGAGKPGRAAVSEYKKRLAATFDEEGREIAPLLLVAIEGARQERAKMQAECGAPLQLLDQAPGFDCPPPFPNGTRRF
jgi:hypothetical protein